MSASSNSPICVDQALFLTAPDGADTYTWTGPDNFVSNEQNPILDNLNTTSAGTYTLEVTFGDCVSETTTEVEIGSTLAATIEGESNICMGSTLSLTITEGTNFEWSGPSGFTATSREIIVNDIGFSNAGVYTVIATNDVGCSTTCLLYTSDAADE